MLRSSALFARAIAPRRTLSLPLARTVSAASPSALAPLAALLPPTVATRPISSSARVLEAAAAASKSPKLRASAGSGQGGKAEKEAARKAKEAARKAREAARKEKEKAKREKDRAKAQRDKERAKAAADKLKERKLKLKAREAAKVKKPRTTSSLHPPKAPQNAWGIFLSDFIAEKKRTLATGEKLASVSVLVKEATPQYQALSAEDKAQLHERSEEQRRAYPDILAAWKATLTPDMIKEENAVRARRRKLGLSRKSNLRLEGGPKKPMTAYLRFSQDVRARGIHSDVLKGETSILEQSKLTAQAWRALSEEEKKEYLDAYAADKERYQREKAAFDAEQASKSEKA